jgi:hypothetical protein
MQPESSWLEVYELPVLAITTSEDRLRCSTAELRYFEAGVGAPSAPVQAADAQFADKHSCQTR